MRISRTLLAFLAIFGSNASSASAQGSPVPEAILPSEGWEFLNGEWRKDCVFYADQDRDGRIDYRRAPTPCGSFNHLVWFDRDGDGFFDADTTDGEPIRVPAISRPMLTRESGERVPCSLWSGIPSTPHVLAAALTSELLVEHEFRHFSVVYPVSPAGGYPIGFNPDGTVESENFRDMRWRISEDGALVIEAAPGVHHEWRYDERCGTLFRELEFGEGRAASEIYMVEDR